MDGGWVAGVWRHPVKSLQGEPVAAAAVGPRGLVGDRAWAVRDVTTGTVLSAKREPRLLQIAARLNGEALVLDVPGEGMAAGAAAAPAVGRFLGREVLIDLAPGAGPAYVDEADLHLVSVGDLEEWDVRRFRPNVVVAGAGSLDDLVGERLAIGRVVVEVTKRTKRCAMTTMAQPGIAKDVGVLRRLAHDSGLCRGVYARVVTAGTVRVDDAVRVA